MFRNFFPINSMLRVDTKRRDGFPLGDESWNGLAAARALTAPLPVVPDRDERARAAARRWSASYTLELASRDDDSAIRTLLRETAFPGDVSLSLEREPDSLAAASIEGDVHQLIVARQRATGKLAAVASRSVRDAFINGKPDRLGYLGQLRIDPAFRSRRGLMDAGFHFCRQLHLAGDARMYLASIVADNAGAARLLTRGSPGWPRFEPLDRLVTLAIPARAPRRPATPGDVRIQRGSLTAIDAIVECLHRNGRRYQLHPRWTAHDLLSTLRTRGLSMDDFLVATRQGRIVGCLARWDQRAFKQVVVRGYCRRLAHWRHVINLAAPWTGIPTLPAVGTSLAFAYLSHVAVDDDDEDVLGALVADACARARLDGLDYVALGLSERSTLLRGIRRRFRHRAYESVVYLAFWPDGEALARSVDPRPSQPELAIL